MRENLMSREVMRYKIFISFWDVKQKYTHRGKEMEKRSTWLFFTLVSGSEAYSTALRVTLVDSSVWRLWLFSLTARRNLRTSFIYTKLKGRCTFLDRVVSLLPGAKKKSWRMSLWRSSRSTTIMASGSAPWGLRDPTPQITRGGPNLATDRILKLLLIAYSVICTHFYDAVSLSSNYPYTAIVEPLKAFFTFNHIVQGLLVGNLEIFKICHAWDTAEFHRTGSLFSPVLHRSLYSRVARLAIRSLSFSRLFGG